MEDSATVVRGGAWNLQEVESVDSTNLAASGLGEWHAIRAASQTAGRGRFQRNWISDEGGLWLSAVVPADDASGGRMLPLVAGLAVCDLMRNLGVGNLRMRWPNDVLVDNRKLAGLLVEQFKPGRAVIGIGINVSNHPEDLDKTLNSQTARVADLIPAAPPLADLTNLLLSGLKGVIVQLRQAGFEALFVRVNELWGKPRPVELDLDGKIRRGIFPGVDKSARLILLDDTGRETTYEPWQVRHLREISNS